MNVNTTIRGILLGALLWPFTAGFAGTPEYDVKARLLRILGNYLVWPPGTEDPNRPLVIGILGDSPFQEFLDQKVEGELCQKRKIHIQYLRNASVSSVAACDILFICKSESLRTAKILSAVKGKPVFTIGDSPDLAQLGVMMNLMVVSGTVNLEVNLKATRAAGMDISSSFLAMAKGKIRIIETP